MHEQGAKRGFLSLVAELLSFELFFGFSSFSHRQNRYDMPSLRSMLLIVSFCR